jgi:hypothetical protein
MNVVEAFAAVGDLPVNRRLLLFHDFLHPDPEWYAGDTEDLAAMPVMRADPSLRWNVRRVVRQNRNDSSPLLHIWSKAGIHTLLALHYENIDKLAQTLHAGHQSAIGKFGETFGSQVMKILISRLADPEPARPRAVVLRLPERGKR